MPIFAGGNHIPDAGIKSGPVFVEILQLRTPVRCFYFVPAVIIGEVAVMNQFRQGPDAPANDPAWISWVAGT